jgi:hypothetical protein
MFRKSISIYISDHSVRALQDTNGLRPLECRGLRLESLSRFRWLCAFNLFVLLLFCVCVCVYIYSGLETGWSPDQGVLPAVRRIKNWKATKSQQGAVEPAIIIQFNSILYYLCAESTVTRPITDTAQRRYNNNNNNNNTTITTTTTTTTTIIIIIIITMFKVKLLSITML